MVIIHPLLDFFNAVFAVLIEPRNFEIFHLLGQQ